MNRSSHSSWFTVFVLFAACYAVSGPAALAQSQPPGFSKSFSPASIGPGSVSTLRLDISNSGSSGVTDMAFTDNLPAAVTVATPASATSTCGGTLSAAAGGGTISLSGGQVGAAQSCAITVNVTAATPGTHSNVTGDLTSSAGNSGNATANLTVATDRPGFSKSFSPAAVPFGGRSTLTFTIDNSANASLASLLTFIDNLPAGMVVASPTNAATTCNGGTITTASGSSSVSYGGGGFVAAGATCTVQVDVLGNSVGSLDNTSGELTSISGVTNRSSGKATASLLVTIDRVSLTKSFNGDPVAPGGTVSLSFTILNRDRAAALTDIQFTDDLDATLSGLSATGLPASNVCGAGSQLSGTDTISLTGGSVPAQGSCTFSVQLQVPASATPGSYVNTTSAITANLAGQAIAGAVASDTLFVSSVPLLSKTFIGDPIGAGETVTLEFTVTNTSPTSQATDITFLDELTTFFPSGLSVGLPAPDFCGSGSTLSFVSLGVDRQALLMSGGTLAAGASCTFSATIDVPVGLANGTYVNTTEVITATVDGATVTGDPATDDLIVVAAPFLLKEFTDDPAQPGGTVTLQFTLTHDENAPGAATDVTFTDDLSATLSGLVATGLPASNVCDTGAQQSGTLSGTSNLTFAGGTLDPGESCTFSVTLAVPANAPAGTHGNTTSAVMATVLGASAMEEPATDDLKIAGLNLSKSFTDDPVLPGGTVNLSFTIDNISPTADATDIQFNDDLDQAVNNMAAAAGQLPLSDICGVGSSLTGASGDRVLLFRSGSLTAGTSCTFDVDVVVPSGTESDTYVNVTSAFSGTLEGSTLLFDDAFDELTVDDNVLTLSKEFIDDPVAPGADVTLRFTLSSLAQKAVTDIGFSDDLDAALTGLASSSGTVADVCGIGSQVSGTSVLTLTGGNLAAGGSCTFDVTVTVPAATPLGTVASNTTSTVTGSIVGLPVVGDPASDDLLVEYLSLSKSFAAPTPAGGTVALSFTLLNVGSVTATDVSFTDDLEAVVSGLVATGLPLNDVCGAGSLVDGTSVVSLTGATVLPSGSCTFSVDVVIPAEAEPASYPNVTSEIFIGEQRGGDPATATLTVLEPPAVCPDRATIDYGGFTAADCGSNNVSVFDQTELDAYLADFGFDGSKVQSVRVMFNPTGDVVIFSPCEVLLRGDGGQVNIAADKVCLYGRKGAEIGSTSGSQGQSLVSPAVTMVSEEGGVFIREKQNIVADELSMAGLKDANVGLNVDIDVSGTVSIVSEGNLTSSDAIIRQNSVVSAENILVSASRGATLGISTQISASGTLDLISTGSFTGSNALIKDSALVSAGTMNQTSGNKVKVGVGVNVDVVGNYHLNADGSCTIAGSATINAGSTSGNCFE